MEMSVEELSRGEYVQRKRLAPYHWPALTYDLVCYPYMAQRSQATEPPKINRILLKS